jgi:hypothetical protein
VSWLFNWDEAAKRPWRTVVSMSLGGLVGGALIGYFRFGHSVGYGVALGVAFALILGTMGWKELHDPERVAQLTSRRPSRAALRIAAIRLAIPFVALAIATVAGEVTHSVSVFVISFAACLVVGFVVSRSLPD